MTPQTTRPPTLRVPKSVLLGYLRSYGKKLREANMRGWHAYARMGNSRRAEGKWAKYLREERRLAWAWQRLANLHFGCFGERLPDPRKYI